MPDDDDGYDYRRWSAKVYGELTTNRLFVYGIFLDQSRRDNYGMYNARYSTVPGYVTEGRGIVQAVPVKNEGIALTGLTVDIDPRMWDRLDSLEGGYDRRVVKTHNNELVWMYTAPRKDEV